MNVVVGVVVSGGHRICESFLCVCRVTGERYHTNGRARSACRPVGNGLKIGIVGGNRLRSRLPAGNDGFDRPPPTFRTSLTPNTVDDPTVPIEPIFLGRGGEQMSWQ